MTDRQKVGDVLDRIDEVLGYSDDMTIEWDESTSSDAMRSRPADEARSRTFGRGIDYVIYDEAAHWQRLHDALLRVTDDTAEHFARLRLTTWAVTPTEGEQ